jgi:hypothetical protein
MQGCARFGEGPSRRACTPGRGRLGICGMPLASPHRKSLFSGSMVPPRAVPSSPTASAAALLPTWVCKCRISRSIDRMRVSIPRSSPIMACTTTHVRFHACHSLGMYMHVQCNSHALSDWVDTDTDVHVAALGAVLKLLCAHAHGAAGKEVDAVAAHLQHMA